MELALDSDLEQSFGLFLKDQAAAASAKEQPVVVEAPMAPSYSSELESEELTELLDLVQAGFAVTWPAGLDARVASIIVKARVLASGAAPS